MKNKFKFIILSLFIIISLTSCKISFKDETLTDTSSKESKETSEKTSEEESSKSKESVISSDITRESLIRSSEEIESSSSESIDGEFTITDLLFDYHDFYGYNALALDSSGELMQDAYETYFEAASEFLVSNKDLSPKKVSGTDYYCVGSYKVNTKDDVNKVINTITVFVQENPIFYFLSNSYAYFTTQQGSKITYEVCMNCSEDYILQSTRQTMNEAILDMVEEIDNNYDDLVIKSDYNICKMVHDFICNRIDYDYCNVVEYLNSLNEVVVYKKTDKEGTYYVTNLEDDKGSTTYDLTNLHVGTSGQIANVHAYDHNILGIVLNKAAVCEGYAKAYLLLTRYYNINSINVVGIAGEVGNQGGHAWNYTKIDGKWYGVDVTWDDQNIIYYTYFLASKSTMESEHSPYGQSSTNPLQFNPVLPELNSLKYNGLF